MCNMHITAACKAQYASLSVFERGVTLSNGPEGTEYGCQGLEHRPLRIKKELGGRDAGRNESISSCIQEKFLSLPTTLSLSPPLPVSSSHSLSSLFSADYYPKDG